MYTVSDMIRTIRSKLQEQNSSKVSDSVILDFLNQGQDFAFDLIARRYPDILGSIATATINSDGITFDMPENAFEQRLTRVYKKDNNYTVPLERVGYREISDFDGRQGYPTNYAILKDKVYLLPSSDISSYTWKYAFVEDIESFVKPQGRIKSVVIGDGSVVNASIVVDAIGSDLSILDSSYNRYANIVDNKTGTVKCTLEIKALDTVNNRITFKLAPTALVDNKTLVNVIPATVGVDDHICVSSGSCIPYFQKPAYNYIIQWAATELKRSLGMDAQMEENALKKYEEQIEKLNSKREGSARVYRRRNPRSDRRW